ncbi:MAG: pentapeptide repeat-containing protein, partial [Planctomycetota bacterium]
MNRLHKAHFHWAHLHKAHLHKAHLHKAHLHEARLEKAQSRKGNSDLPARRHDKKIKAIQAQQNKLAQTVGNWTGSAPPSLSVSLSGPASFGPRSRQTVPSSRYPSACPIVLSSACPIVLSNRPIVACPISGFCLSNLGVVACPVSCPEVVACPFSEVRCRFVACRFVACPISGGVRG